MSLAVALGVARTTTMPAYRAGGYRMALAKSVSRVTSARPSAAHTAIKVSSEPGRDADPRRWTGRAQRRGETGARAYRDWRPAELHDA